MPQIRQSRGSKQFHEVNHQYRLRFDSGREILIIWETLALESLIKAFTPMSFSYAYEMVAEYSFTIVSSAATDVQK